MASPQEIQAQIDSANTMHVAIIQQSTKIDATYDAHYVQGISPTYAGKAKWCQTTAANSAAQQATEITDALVL